MTAYTSALFNVSLAGPTLFGHVVTNAAFIASQSVANKERKYFILLIITVCFKGETCWKFYFLIHEEFCWIFYEPNTDKQISIQSILYVIMSKNQTITSNYLYCIVVTVIRFCISVVIIPYILTMFAIFK